MLNLIKDCKSVILVLLLVIPTLVQCGEYFSSIMGLESLLQTEGILLADMREYISASKLQIEALESEFKKIHGEHELALADTEYYLTSPVNVYRLISRLSTDWNTYEISVRYNNAAKNFLERIAHLRTARNFPTQEDIEGSASALVRLQETYQLEVAQVAAGILNGVKYGTDMTWQDCYSLGQHLYALEEYNHTKGWLKESMTRLSKEAYHKDSASLSFMEGVALSLYHLGDLEAALNLTNEVIEFDPKRISAWNIRDDIETALESANHEVLSTVPNPYHTTEEFKLYEKVCRGEITATATQLRPLRCRYLKYNHPYRLLAPFKVEEHNLEPLVLVFHDMISDARINTIKQMAMPRMKRSTVRAPDAKRSSKADFRISKNAWLKYHRHRYMKDMLQDLHAATGLEVTDCEQLQVANYGLGGHYEPHWDFYLEEETIPEGEGNRIATAIYYFSDVEQGGATAFPFLNIAIKPQKGSVLFWYNLHHSLDGDYRTKHAGCPVLKGSKWISNIWISDLTQAFTRPCLLHKDNEISVKYENTY